MSETQQQQQLPPTAQETQQALDAIQKDRRVEAAAALRELCECIIKSVTAVDRSYNVGAYLQRVELLAKGEGNFELRLYERDTGVDVSEICQQVSDAIAAEGADYGKVLRSVQLSTRPGG